MALVDAYATKDEYYAAHGKTSTTDDIAVNRTLEAVSRLIDKRLDRKNGFLKDAAATIRIYVPKGTGRRQRDDWAESENPWLYGGMTRVLDVEDIGGAITSILLDETNDNTYGTTLATNDYELLPRNAAVHGEPYRQISMTPWGSYAGGWPAGRHVKVTAIHGWPSVPAAIKVATIELAAILMIDSAFATGRISELDQTVEASPQARKVLNDLMAVYSVGVYF